MLVAQGLNLQAKRHFAFQMWGRWARSAALKPTHCELKINTIDDRLQLKLILIHQGCPYDMKAVVEMNQPPKVPGYIPLASISVELF